MPFKNTTLAGFCSSSRAYNVTVFSADPNGPKRATRRKLDAKGRAKVHAVRRTGACLTCRMLKVPCDIPDPENPGPCKRCLAIASRPQQKGLLAFRECIRTKIRDVNIFQHTLDIDYTSLQSPKLLSLLSKTVDRTEGVSSLPLPEILSSIFTWMLPKQGKSPEQSIVGSLICSDQFRQLAQNDSFFGGGLLEKFRVMIYSSTLAYVYDSGSREIYDSDLTMRDLHRITYAMGSDLLLFLDNALVPHQLSKLSQEQLSGLFVIIFGISLAVAYSTAVYDSPTFNAGVETGGETPRTLWQALQQHLSQMLAHHLVILGARLGLVLRGDSEKEIISSLMSAIIYRGNFVWVAQQRAVELPEPSSSQATPLTETTENTEQLFILNIPEDDAKVDPTTGALGVKKLDSYRSTPVSVRSLQTIQNTLKAIMPSDDDDEGTNEFMSHNESDSNSPRLGRGRRFCQTARKSNSRASRNTSQNASMPPASYCANKSAGRKFKARSRQFHPEPQRSYSQTSNPTVTSENTPEMSQATTSSSTTSTNGYGSITSSNEDTNASSTTASTNPPCPFQTVSIDLDFEMELSSDPFGIGWLPEPEPEPQPELPQTLDTPTNTSKNANNNIPFTPSVWAVQSPEPAPSVWGAQNTIIPPSPLHPTNSTSSSSTGSGPYIWAYQGAATSRSTKSTNASNATTPNNPIQRHQSLWACQEQPHARRRQPNIARTDPVGLGSYPGYPPWLGSASQQAIPSPPPQPQPQPQPPTIGSNSSSTGTASQSSAPFIWASQEIDNMDFTNPPNPSNPSLSSIRAPPAPPSPPQNHVITPSTTSGAYPEAPYIYAPQNAAEFLGPNGSEDDEQIKEITLPGSIYHSRPSSGSNTRPRKKHKTNDKDQADDWAQVRDPQSRRFVQNRFAQRRWRERAKEKATAKAQEQEQQQPPQPQPSPAQEGTLDEDPYSKPPPVLWSPQTAAVPYVHGANLDITPYPPPVSRAPGLSSEPASTDAILPTASGFFNGDEDGEQELNSNDFYNLYDANSYFGPVKKRPVI